MRHPRRAAFTGTHPILEEAAPGVSETVALARQARVERSMRDSIYACAPWEALLRRFSEPVGVNLLPKKPPGDEPSG